MDGRPPQPDILSHFWAPLCAVGANGPRGPNAQICVSVFGASIVPERPRILVCLSNTNYTTRLVRDSGRFAVTVLSESQLHLLEPLGLHSGRDRDKLAGLEIALTPTGEPWFPGGTGYLACDVITTYDLGDMTGFLSAVRHRETFGGKPLSWHAAREVVGDDFLRRWQEKSLREQEAARRAMHWR
ncbi:MAG: flavin reductase family protein [Dehalococcoidia bacterium]